MAGTTVATWVKVKTKTGMTARPISHKYEGGAGYDPGQVITQSEYEKLKAEGNKNRENAKAQPSQSASLPKTETEPGVAAQSPLRDSLVAIKRVTIPSQKTFADEDVNKMADAIISAKGVIEPLIVRRQGLDYELVSGSFNAKAAKVAKQKNLAVGENAKAVILTPENERAVMQQVSLFRKSRKKEDVDLDTIKLDPDAEKFRNTFAKQGLASALVGVKNVKSKVPESSYSTKELDKGARLIVEAGGVINPIVLKRTGLNSFDVVSGHFEYHAAQRAKQLNPRVAENINSVILDSDNMDGVINQLKIQRQRGSK